MFWIEVWGIGIEDLELRIWIWIGDWGIGLGWRILIGVWDRRLGIRIGDWGFEFGIGIDDG